MKPHTVSDPESPPAPLRIAHYYAQALTHRSGVTAAMNEWAVNQHAAGAEVTILSAHGALLAEEMYDVPVRVVPHLGRSRATFVPRRRSLAKAFVGYDVVILHEGWTLSHYVSAEVARSVQLPYVVMPHGVYEPEIVQGLKRPRRLRHQLERRLLTNAAAVHVFFNSEIPLVERIAPRAVPHVSPTGIDAADALPPRASGEGPLLWFGRIDVRHKGLDLLLNGLAETPAESRPRLRIAGYDYDGGMSELTELIRLKRLDDWVSLEGPIHGQAKAEALATAGAYVHPSRWECHSIALMEALASGAPVLVNEGAHISSLLRETGGGQIVASRVAAWAAAIRRYSDEGISAQHRDGVFRALTWERAIAQNFDLIRSLKDRPIVKTKGSRKFP